MTEHVIVAGGGIGALEGVLALQELGGDALRISVLTPNRFLTYRALSVGEPAVPVYPIGRARPP